MIHSAPRRTRPGLLAAGCALALLAGCAQNGYDWDMRGMAGLGFDTSEAAQSAVQSRPEPDGRGVISYPTYQVAVARSGDTVASVASRVGIDTGELARYNAVEANATLNRGEILALPRRVAEPVVAVASAPATGGAATETVDITALASSAIDRAAPQGTATPAPVAAPAAPQAPPAATTAEPVRHKVTRGETAYSIARYYNVPVKSLAEWNGLASDMSVREGQYLLIPLASAAAAVPTTQPGQGSPTPEPPSAAKPLPSEQTVAAATPVDKSAAPNMGAARSTSAAQMAMPVSGAIIRPYVKGRNDGIDISAAAGTPVKAAEAGTVAAITRDTEQVPILVVRHADGLMTVYANIDDITVAKGDTVKRGQTIAKARAGGDNSVHFEVRKGLDSVDPVPYLE